MAAPDSAEPEGKKSDTLGGPERRRFDRVLGTVRPRQARRLGQQGWEPLLAVTVLNASAGGLLLTADQPLVAGDYMELEFETAGSGIQLTVRVDVLWAQLIETRAVRLWRAGCQFQQPTPAIRDLIAQLIMEHQQVPDAGGRARP